MIETFQFCFNSAVLVFTFISDLTNFKVLFIIHCKKVSYVYLYIVSRLTCTVFAHSKFCNHIDRVLCRGGKHKWTVYPGIIPGCYLDQFQMINSRADSNADNDMI